MKRYIYILYFLAITFTAVSQEKLIYKEEAGTKLVKFYPNPASTFINFDFINGYDKSISFEIYSFIGKKIYELKAPAARVTIDLNEYFRGIYYYKVVDKTGRIIDSGKFLVIK